MILNQNLKLSLMNSFPKKKRRKLRKLGKLKITGWECLLGVRVCSEILKWQHPGDRKAAPHPPSKKWFSEALLSQLQKRTWLLKTHNRVYKQFKWRAFINKLNICSIKLTLPRVIKAFLTGTRFRISHLRSCRIWSATTSFWTWYQWESVL